MKVQMICSLNCFCDFLEAKTPEGQAAVVKRYKRNTTEAAKGMMIYYSPVLRIIRGKLCPQGNLGEKLSALRDACIVPSWTDKLNDARIASNVRVYRAFRSVFGDRKVKVLSSPRMQYLASTDVAINIHPELYAEIDGQPMLWKFGMCKDPRPDGTIQVVLQILAKAARHKGLEVPITQIGYLDTVTGKTYIERSADPKLESTLQPTVQSLSRLWEKAAK